MWGHKGEKFSNFPHFSQNVLNLTETFWNLLRNRIKWCRWRFWSHRQVQISTCHKCPFFFFFFYYTRHNEFMFHVCELSVLSGGAGGGGGGGAGAGGGETEVWHLVPPTGSFCFFSINWKEDGSRPRTDPVKIQIKEQFGEMLCGSGWRGSGVFMWLVSLCTHSLEQIKGIIVSWWRVRVRVRSVRSS